MTKISLRYKSPKYFCKVKLGAIISSCLLSGILLFNTLQVSLTYAYYEIDPIGFIEQLCENKEKPELKCNGKCQLKKVVENSADNDKLPNLIDFKELQLFKETTQGINTFEEFIIAKQCFEYQNLYTFLEQFDCFHPPKQFFL